MAAEEYGFRFTLDGQQAVKSLQELKDQSKRFESALNTATDPAQINRLTRALDASKAAIRNFGKEVGTAANSTKALVPGANQAGNALTNLGRVAQDAPFGFVGIQNNLNPLLESFQRLKAESGSTGGAIKALTSQLNGPAGFGLALSVGGALLVAFGDKLFAASAEAQRAALAQKEYNEEISKGIGQVAGETAKVEALIGVVKNETISKENRNKAVKQLQELYPAYFKNLNTENASTAAIKAQTDALTAALLRKAKATALTNLITKESEKLAQLQNASIEDQANSIGFLDKALSVIKNGFGGVAATATVATDLVNRGLTKTAQDSKNAEANIKNYTAALNNVTTEQFKFGDDLEKASGKTKKQKVEIDEYTKALNKLNLQYQNGLISTQQFGRESIALTQKQLLEGKNVAVLRQRLAELQAQYEKPTYRTFAMEQQKVTFNTQSLTTSTLAQAAASIQATTASVNYNGVLAAQEQQTLKIAQAQASQAEIVANLLSPAFSGLFNGLLEGENAFQAFFKQIKQLITRLIAAALAALALQTILTALFPGAGGFKGAGGFGKLFQSLGGFNLGSFGIPGLATGGVVTGPTLAMVGEGSESEAVLPLSVLDNMVNGGGGNSTIIARFSGRQFLEFIQTAQRDQDRLNF